MQSTSYTRLRSTSFFWLFLKQLDKLSPPIHCSTPTLLASAPSTSCLASLQAGLSNRQHSPDEIYMFLIVGFLVNDCVLIIVFDVLYGGRLLYYLVCDHTYIFITCNYYYYLRLYKQWATCAVCRLLAKCNLNSTSKQLTSKVADCAERHTKIKSSGFMSKNNEKERIVIQL